MSKKRQLVGILGGMGPQAGVDMAEKLIAATHADSDQDHIPFVLFSYPGTVPDRTAYLLGHTDINPAFAIAEQLEKMAELGVTTAVVACNTAHASPIFDVILKQLRDKQVDLQLLHLVEETTNHIFTHFPRARRIGVLGTIGTYQSGLYEQALKNAGLEAVLPDPVVREDMIQAAIYAPGFGIKACAGKISSEARRRIYSAISHLNRLGVEGVILGCTELPLAIDEDLVDGVPMLDPARIVAAKMVQLICPDKGTPIFNQS
jgi:aspartate racemase